ncbi:MAG: diguanylate cyclase, partial [Deinococcus sp.]|nr:diguanylate cyclase [Deinococcus sp.]
GLRGYVIAGNQAFLEPYISARAQLPQTLNGLAATAQRTGSPERLEHVQNLRRLLDRWQVQVAEPEIDTRPRSKEEAEAIVARGDGKRLIDAVRAEKAAYDQLVHRALEAHRSEAAAQAQRLQLTLLLTALTLLLVAAGAAWWGAGWLARQFSAVTLAARQLAQGQWTALPAVQLSEQRDLAQAFNEMGAQLSEARAQAQARTADLEEQGALLRHLGQLNDLLLSARSLDEGGEIVARVLPQLLPASSGTLFVYAASRNLLRPLAHWGTQAEEDARSQAPQDCWALRRGEGLWPGERALMPPCLKMDGHAPYTCLPLTAHGEALGLLRITLAGEPTPATRHALGSLSRQLSLSLDALQLQDQLRQQSIRDALTGLYNRRYYEDHLAASVARALSSGEPLSLLALDVDHFKRFNDTFGHDAGDAVLVQVGAALREAALHPGEAACRPGGEEFSLILPGVGAAQALRRAEALRAQVAGWTLKHAGLSLGRVTMSVGVATLNQGGTPASLVRQADEALYAAKRGGRNRVLAWTADPDKPATEAPALD